MQTRAASSTVQPAEDQDNLAGPMLKGGAKTDTGGGGGGLDNDESFRSENDMVIEDASGEVPPHPIRSFDEAGFPDALLKMVSNVRVTKASACSAPTLQLSRNAWRLCVVVYHTHLS